MEPSEPPEPNLVDLDRARGPQDPRPFPFVKLLVVVCAVVGIERISLLMFRDDVPPEVLLVAGGVFVLTLVFGLLGFAAYLSRMRR